ncbi:isoleucine--tRNA ligase, cytoplasmic isoform X2 [Callithrix jacchus]
MYQNLKVLIDPVSFQDKDTLSIHHLMLPCAREELIDKKTQSAVPRMQSAIELECVIRDRKTIPRKELNVQKVTPSTDKNKYGIWLRSEPDHMVLGKRLKGAFKAVMTSIKQLSSEELEQFQKTASLGSMRKKATFSGWWREKLGDWICDVPLVLPC